MGEMTIRLDDALLVALQERADTLGKDVEDLAADLLRTEFVKGTSERFAIADTIRSRTAPSTISSVTLLDQIRDEGL